LFKIIVMGGARMRERLYFTAMVIFVATAITTSPCSVRAASDEPDGQAGGDGAAVHILDGKKFKGQTGEVGKKTHHEDVLVFEDGYFTSIECYQFGFESGPYTATKEPDGIRFKAVTHSSTHGKMEWEGTLRGDILEVAYAWTKERWLCTTFRKYWFKGTLVQ
jgi:hypothetical protein